jgi:hypothetical protein
VTALQVGDRVRVLPIAGAELAGMAGTVSEVARARGAGYIVTPDSPGPRLYMLPDELEPLEAAK